MDREDTFAPSEVSFRIRLLFAFESYTSAFSALSAVKYSWGKLMARVKLAKNAGFCMGVRRAMDMTLEAAMRKDGPIYTYGP